MRPSRAWIGRISGLVLSLTGAVCLTTTAQAQTSAALFVGNSVTVDGLKFTVTGCTIQIASASATACPAAGANAMQLLATASRGANIQVIGQAAGNTGAIFSAASSSASGLIYDLNYTLAVSVASGSPIVTSVASTLAGTTTSTAYNANVSLSDTLYKGSPLTAFASQSANLGSSPLTQTSTFAGINALSVTNDLKLISQNGQTLTLSNMRQVFSPAPEPVSMGLFVMGLAGLGLARRRRARLAA